MNPSDVPKPIRRMIDEAIDIEVAGSSDPGGHTNDPADPGGETRWGVTARVARKYGYMLDMRNYPRTRAFNVFLDEYVEAPGFRAVAERSIEIASELIEAGINLGPDRPSRWFQRTLNTMNVRQGMYPDILVDGNIGPKTLQVGLDGYLKLRDPNVITMQLNHMQGAEYMRLAESNEMFERFIYGWIKQRTRVVDIPGKLEGRHLLAA